MLEEFDFEQVENEMLENFGDKFLEDALRIVQTRTYSALDEPLIHEAMCIVVAIYTRKIREGEINQDKVLH